ncbi:DUF4138 domain-containing protein [Chitinophaga sp. S165]|uniref:DUF4138 domain-containing protein n=1 Tax=Chitinophaga sp. S165 TaxID=2135462 RepID=UPI000D9652B0|nr:DUF4138 domain-containing protein [Chitinophaga sp. S165]PWV47139.1 conjugative transposon TraN protein [Chitinophaga sp. S165]
MYLITAHYRYCLTLILIILNTAMVIGQPTPASMPTYKLEVSTNNTTVLIFPAPISAVDRGKSTLLAKSVAGVENILKIKAASDTMPTTSLHVFTVDGRVFPFEVHYHSAATGATFDFSAPEAQILQAPLQFSSGPLTETAIGELCQQLTHTQSFMKAPRSKKIGDVHLVYGGSYLCEGVLFIQLQLHNHSQIPYPLHFNQALVRDRRKSKRTSQMEVEKQILRQSNIHGQIIPANTNATIVLAFTQFTIADGKVLAISAFEHGGDRHLELRLKGKHLLRSRTLPSAVLNAVSVRRR